MSSVTFATFCYWKDAPAMHAPGILEKLVRCHNYQFDEVLLVHQNCRGKDLNLRPITELPVRIIETENHPKILTEFGIPEDDPVADHWTHGPNHSHYWKWHVINHLNALKESNTDYIVFTDSDITMAKNGPPSWVEAGIKVLEKYPDAFIVSPDDGGNDHVKRVAEGRFTSYFSQQIFLARRQQLLEINWNVPYDATALYEDPTKRTSDIVAPNRPFQEFYFMNEGRMWRWSARKTLKEGGPLIHQDYRFLLDGSRWRYWHWQGKIGGQ